MRQVRTILLFAAVITAAGCASEPAVEPSAGEPAAAGSTGTQPGAEGGPSSSNQQLTLNPDYQGK